MAIGTDAGIHVFGTEDSLATTTSDVTDGSFSDGTNDLLAWTNDDDAPEIVAVFTWTYSSGTLATPVVYLHRRMQSIDGSSHEPVPDASNRTQIVGAFLIDPAQGATIASHAIVVPLPNVETSTVYHWYIENQTGVTIPAGWDLSITPRALEPHA